MIGLLVRPLAELDIQDATDWYEDEEAGLGGRWLDELRDTLQRIRELPRHCPEVGLGARRALLKRFPYAIYFLLRGEGDERSVIVLAVLHQRRSSSVWRGRLGGQEKKG